MRNPKPHRRVLTLALVLVGLIVTTVAVSVFEFSSMRSDFDELVDSDYPRFDTLLHLDRDLFRAQRALGIAINEPDSVRRSEYLAEYDNQVERTDRWWSDYLDVSANRPDEPLWQSDYGTSRAVWVASSGEIARLVEITGDLAPSAVGTRFDNVRSDFALMRAAVDKLEEQVAEPEIDDSTNRVVNHSRQSVIELLVILAFGLSIGTVFSVAAYRASKKQFLLDERRDKARDAAKLAADFETELGHALEMAQTETAAVDTLRLVLEKEIASQPVELLLADSSQAHLSQLLTTDAVSHGPGCPVQTPDDCPAIRRGATLDFEDSESYSACPNLRGRGGEPCSAVCVPVTIAGRTVGVLHTTGVAGQAPDEDTVYKLGEIAERSGDRIGVIRAFAKSQSQAATDPLTGLANRRSFENGVSELLRENRPLAIAYGDLDHFKDLNDTFGHDAGDRALRLFSRVVRDSLRDQDMAARWGGEEFVIMFDHADADTAAAALERLRQNLSIAISGGTTPPFTVSFGVADTTLDSNLLGLVNLADDALLDAKRSGRNRVIISGRDAPTDSVDSPETAEPLESQPQR